MQPARRGGGLGARLVARFSAWVKEVGAEPAEAAAYSSNTDALRFYERNAFASHTVTLRTAS
ncbi:GNAT family N-acetyltransferase [Streptomyces sp. NPDC085927]|uniref:GNAT family N-acetyltransferase n=1 Tax=Streptomyces sp. NPDC085927 TaxID=3365738 RepID=UPI0037D4E829